MIMRSLLMILLTSLALPLVAQDLVVKTTKIEAGFYLLQGRGGNVLASLGDDGLLLIDSDYGNYASAYQDAVNALGQEQVKYLINTHWHGDHTGSNAYWGDQGSLIFAHDNVLARMSTRQENKLFNSVTEPSPRSAWPVVTYEDSLALHFNGDIVEAQHYPTGHTDGDTAVFFLAANIVHLGDHFFKDRFPFVDHSSGGSVKGFIRNIGLQLDKLDSETVIVPGHGGLAKKEDLQRYYAMLKSTRDEVKAMQAQGMDLAAMQAQGLDSKWESWGSGFIDEKKWISFLAAPD